jgi:vitamin B12 transporter
VKGKKILALLLTKLRYLVNVYTAALLISPSAGAQDTQSDVELDPVIITATRIPGAHSARLPVRAQETVIIDDHDRLLYRAVPSILKDGSTLDVRTRGPHGIQADISVRGAPFEQNLVLLDGISLNDPKSGHHNTDLPLTLYDIERIDVTYGASSSVYGSGALGGAVNIIPRRPDEKVRIAATSAAGSWDFYSAGASINTPAGPLRNRASIEWRKSGGYAPETEFNTMTASTHSEIRLADVRCSLFAGYLTKRFGADSFYSDRFPNEEESVNTGLISAKAEVIRDEVSFTPFLYWKRLQDTFILDRHRPSFSRNDHTTNFYGGGMGSHVETTLGTVAFGADIGEETISSTNLGEHSRIRSSTFLEYEMRISSCVLNTTVRLDSYSTLAAQWSPSLQLGYEILPGTGGKPDQKLIARAGVARAFRVPTFTDLYYSSPANRGNPDLEPESAWTYDAGFDLKARTVSASGTVFFRSTEDSIDWTRTGSSAIWQAGNIGEIDMYGIEGSLRYEWVAIRYAYLEALDKKSVTSKYVLEYLKHNLTATLTCPLPFGSSGEILLGFKKRVGRDAYFLLDATLRKEMKIEKGTLSAFVTLCNILDTDYSDVGNVRMPGFSAYGGIAVDF